jgi:2-iminobutanoate/2-iminopropanoate deaminase
MRIAAFFAKKAYKPKFAYQITIIPLISFKNTLMPKTIINTTKAPAPIGPYNQAILKGDELFISGQIGLDPATGQLNNQDIATETRQVMLNLQAILDAAGMNFSHVIKTTIFLTDMHQFAQVNEVYGSFFVADFPARETVQVSALPKFVNVEISMIAAR